MRTRLGIGRGLSTKALESQLLILHSSYPRNVPKHEQFTFMDLIHREDRDLVMSMWNTLTQGCPVTFEMRWKLCAGYSETSRWALTSCIPIFDDDKVLISIAGNAIDIDEQKKAQEATQARVEALEQARLSEMKFARFAKLSPIAIYIFLPETGKWHFFCRNHQVEQYFVIDGLHVKPNSGAPCPPSLYCSTTSETS
jgi:hypothetical protein